ncbi:MAG: helix-turn-helix domain-containing protein [Patescibacteria group bacterium]|jgi:sugar-specific transcriptional regulator TrmB
MTLEQILKQYGLNEKEAKVYLAILELGTCTVLELSKKSELKRPTVYRILDELKSKGLVATTPKEDKLFYSAEKPLLILEDLERKSKLIKNSLPVLEALFNRGSQKPKVKFYEGRQGLIDLMYDGLNCQSKMIYYLWPVTDMFETIGKEEIENFIQERIKRKIYIKTIRIKSKEREYKASGHGKQYYRELKYAPKDFDFSIGLIIYDNKVIIISSKKENYGLMIESLDFKQVIEGFFNLLWQSSLKSK